MEDEYLSDATTRANWAAERLAYLHLAHKLERFEFIEQRFYSWLELATPGEVRRYYRNWMGSFPSWATKRHAR